MLIIKISIFHLLDFFKYNNFHYFKISVKYIDKYFNIFLNISFYYYILNIYTIFNYFKIHTYLTISNLIFYNIYNNNTNIIIKYHN